MHSITIKPGFSDTDALGHINNTRIPAWFENGREPFFKLFTPDLDINNWRLIVARITVDFHRQLYMTEEVEIRSSIQKIGNSSFVVRHEAWQKGACAASGEAVMIHFDYAAQLSKPIPDDIRVELEKHIIEEA